MRGDPLVEGFGEGEYRGSRMRGEPPVEGDGEGE